MENSLFNKTKLDNFVRKYNNLIKITEDIRNIISKWLEKIENRKLEDERLNYGNFQDLILRQLLGYDINDISTNYQTEGNESVEFVLKKEDEAYVAIELKGSSSNIDSYRNHKNETPMQQVSRYATSQKSFKWCIVSNYDEFRLFSKNSRKEYISFRFKDLTNDTILKKFLLIFSKVSLIDNDIPSKLIIDGVNDKNFEDEFYKLFSETRFMLIKELKSFSNLNSDDAIHYAQLILNRYIFICFAEDKLLIPSNISIETITTPLKLGNLSHKKPRIWQRINELFEDIDEGRSAKNINAFNGGLFKEDLSHLIIRDYVEDDFFNDCKTNWKFNKKDSDIINNLMYGKKEYINPIYYNLLFIAHFDFNTELDTNILGHIFENSIGDIEEIKKGQSNRAISERNKKGIFYTPAFITDYILKNTIIPYLSKSGNICNVDDLIKEYDVDIDSLKELDYKLKNIKILDPACGSGAFLNKATDILLEIHEKLFVKLNEKRFVNQKTSLDNFYDNIAVRRKILINNIYGVDLNQESVELTKLSMFLKVATKNMELPTLDNNIKCGNSIIDDYDIAMDKSFVWEDEFANILEEGGFDIIIGNPPYVRHELIPTNEKRFLKDNFITCTDSTNLFTGFFERSLNLLKKDGFFSFICSNKFATVDYGKKLRKFLLNYKIVCYNDYSGEKLFKDAEVDACIIVIKKSNPANNKILVDKKYELPQEFLNYDFWFFSNVQDIILKEKLLKKGTPLNDIEFIEINNGIKTGLNEAFYINSNIKNILLEDDPKNQEIIKPLVVGKNIKPWYIDYQEQYLIFTRRGIDIDEYPSIKKYLEQFKDDLKPKSNKTDKKGRKKGSYQWYEIQDKTDFYKNFEKPKLIWAEMNKDISVCFDENNFYVNNKCFIITSDKIDLKFLNGLFLSKLFYFIFKALTSSLGKDSFELRKSYVKQVPIILDKNYISKISQKVELNLEFNRKKYVEITNFLKWLFRTFNIEKSSKKINAYYELSFEEFIIELKKKKVTFNQRKKQELIEKEFKDSVALIKNINNDIKYVENEVNRLVYNLYGLSDEEISIVEKNQK